jgi:cell wall-associated NlpC family hydrolase
MVEYAKSFLGTKYEWGGEDSSGIDCSGLVLECLWAIGMGPDKDMTAKQLSDWMTPHSKTEYMAPGSVLFFTTKDLVDVKHCAIAIDSEHMIEAKGGKFVRIRPIKVHDGKYFMYFLDPIK